VTFLNTNLPTSWRVICSSMIGTILEWYEFSLFAFLSPMLATYFFPKENAFTGLMMTYAIFAIGFFVRPLGAAWFGHYGDRAGRKQALVYSIVLMALSTFLIGLLPTYHDIGVAAPILLIVLRIAQGLSAGGESTGAILFVLEADHYKRRGFIGGLLWAVVGVGMLLGSFMAMLVTTHADCPWGWRVPFLLSIFTGFIGYFVRKRTPESLQFQQALAEDGVMTFPLYEGFVHYKWQMLRIMGVYTLSAMITYVIFIFMPTYAANVVGLPLSDVTITSTIALASVTFLVPLGGYVSDLMGQKKSLRYFAMGFFVLSYPLFMLIAKGSLSHFRMADIVFVVLAAGFQGSINAFVVDQLPVNVRYSVMAVSYNMAYSLFGGTAPMIASLAVNLTGDKAAPGLYLMFGAMIALLSTKGLNTEASLRDGCGASSSGRTDLASSSDNT